MHHALHFVADLPEGFRLRCQHSLFAEGPEGLLHAVSTGLFQCRQLSSSAAGKQEIQHAFGPFDPAAALSRGFPVQTFHHLPEFPELIPQPGRQNGPHRLVQRTEIPLAQKQCQGDALTVQHRFPVQRSGNAFQLRRLGAVFRTQNDSLRAAVTTPEGNGDTDAGADLILQQLRDQIIIGFVDGIGRGSHRYFRNRGALHSASLPVLRRCPGSPQWSDPCRKRRSCPEPPRRWPGSPASPPAW